MNAKELQQKVIKIFGIIKKILTFLIIIYALACHLTLTAVYTLCNNEEFKLLIKCAFEIMLLISVLIFIVAYSFSYLSSREGNNLEDKRIKWLGNNSYEISQYLGMNTEFNTGDMVLKVHYMDKIYEFNLGATICKCGNNLFELATKEQVKEMYFENEKKDLLKKGKNEIFVWDGCGYVLDVITTNRNKMSIEELAYICIKSDKGLFIRCSQLSNESLAFLEKNGCIDDYIYCDMSNFNLENGFLLIENLKTNGVEVFS